MNLEIKEKWLEYLRSGRFEKNKSKLRNGNRYCCLGVFCQLYQDETGDGTWDAEDRFIVEEMYHMCVLPQKIVEWAGLPNTNPTVPNDFGFDAVGHRVFQQPFSEVSLIGANDSTETFEEVIQLIDKYL